MFNNFVGLRQIKIIVVICNLAIFKLFFVGEKKVLLTLTLFLSQGQVFFGLLKCFL